MTNDFQKEKRNIGIDCLKLIGLLLIILAHTTENSIILQIRSFDVPLMVILSGILSVNSFKKEENTWKYYKKRFLRLVIPTYIFIIIYFTLIKVLKVISGDLQYRTDFYAVIKSFLLSGGIGYIWIIRVYLLMAMITPTLVTCKEKMNNKLFYSGLLLIYIVYEIVYQYIGNANWFLEYVLYYIIPYGEILAIGIFIGEKQNNKKIKILGYLFGIIFIAIAILQFVENGHFVYTNEFKYPPRIYYISYAMFAAINIISIIQKLNFDKLNKKVQTIIIFISKHSLWIYLWHIIYVSIFIWCKLNVNWIVKYIFVVSMSIVTVGVQVWAINQIEKKKKIEFLKYLKY